MRKIQFPYIGLVLLGCMLMVLSGAILKLEREIVSLKRAAVQPVAQKPEEKKKVERKLTGHKPEKARSFKVRSLWGKEVTIWRDPWKKSRPVVMHLWGPWCAPCRYEFPAMLSFSKRHRNLPIIAVSVNSEQKYVEKFLDKVGWDESKYRSIFVSIGSEETVVFAGDYYEVITFPTTIFVDADGNIVKRVDGTMNWRDPEIEKLARDFEKQSN